MCSSLSIRGWRDDVRKFDTAALRSVGFGSSQYRLNSKVHRLLSNNGTSMGELRRIHSNSLSRSTTPTGTMLSGAGRMCVEVGSDILRSFFRNRSALNASRITFNYPRIRLRQHASWELECSTPHKEIIKTQKVVQLGCLCHVFAECSRGFR